MRKTDKVKIKGVTGFGHWPFNERVKGRLDVKHDQVSSDHDLCTTPWIQRKTWNCENYINQAYFSAAKELEKVHRETYVAAQQMRELSAEEFPETRSELAEQTQRLAAERSRKKLRNQETGSQLRVRLAEIEAMVEEKDTDLTHRIKQVEATLHDHVLAYWEGVRRGNGAGRLPVFPTVQIDESAGQQSYARKRDELLSIIRQATGNDHKQFKEAVI